MYKKLVFALMLVLLVAQFAVPSVAADEPVGSCPPEFTLHEVMPHDEHHHQHVGTSTDRNDDDFICMKHITPDESIHVHVDNNLPISE
ncbi:MAG TPA: hypothetical protein VFY83_01690 [Anaerolineales bacterium]|nr:hypothetical protein [Anaerolineales bacterium]